MAALNKFKERNGEGAVVLGLDSYMRGIDCPGEQLQAVVIAKTPIPRMGIVGVARSDAYFERTGRNYGEDMALRTLEQCAGRLIRTGNDKGVVMLCEYGPDGKYYHMFEDAVAPSDVIEDPN